MRRNYTLTYLWTTSIIAIAISINFAFARDKKLPKGDTTYLHIQKNKNANAKNSYLKNGLHLTLPPIKPAATSNVKVNIGDKLLNNVQIYPNPVTEQITMKYEVSRNANVTIKIMDILGNEVITIFSQRVDPGEKNFTYSLNNKLPRGFYFVRIVVGTESVIKRISVL